jgi:hypothetical protein
MTSGLSWGSRKKTPGTQTQWRDKFESEATRQEKGNKNEQRKRKLSLLLLL